MKTKLILGLSSILGLGLAACSDTSGDNPDAAYIPPEPDTALPTNYDVGGGAIDTTPVVADPYVWVVIQDTEQNACNTNGPGADIDAVALQDAAGTVLGYGKVGTATYTPNGTGACDNANCSGGVCKYAANGGVFTLTDLQSRTEGPSNGVVNAATNDEGYFSLNAGTLQMQIGSGPLGAGPAVELTAGGFIYVYEVDKYFIEMQAAPDSCVCQPENYTVSVQTAAGVVKQLVPVRLETANAAYCSPLTAASTQGCGTTMFMIP